MSELDPKVSLFPQHTDRIIYVNKFGRNTDVDLTAEDVWDGGGVWAAPTAARVHTVVSTDDADGKTGAPSSVGARTVRVYGLQDWNSAESSEVITLDGTTGVPTVNSYVIVHRIKVLTAGSSGPNVGVITATPAVSGSAATISIGIGQTLMAIYGVPSHQTLYVTGYYAGLNQITTGSFDIFLKVNQEPADNANTYLVKHVLSSTSSLSHKFDPYARFDGPLIIKMTADAGQVNSDISAGFDGIIL